MGYEPSTKAIKSLLKSKPMSSSEKRRENDEFKLNLQLC